MGAYVRDVTDSGWKLSHPLMNNGRNATRSTGVCCANSMAVELRKRKACDSESGWKPDLRGEG